MATPHIHSKNSAKKFGGKPEDYHDIHQLMDSSKASFSDARHRSITHNIWFCVMIIPRIFGEERINSDNKSYSPKDVAEMHCLEDMGMIPTVQDFLENMKLTDWMKGDSTTEKPIVNSKVNQVYIPEFPNIDIQSFPPADSKPEEYKDIEFSEKTRKPFDFGYKGTVVLD